MKKRIFLFAIIFVVMGSVFAESKSFSFGELTDDNLIVTLNTSQSTLDKNIKSTGSSIQVYTKVPFSNYANTMSITFIEPLIIENISNFKSAKLTGKSLGYDATVILHFMNSERYASLKAWHLLLSSRLLLSSCFIQCSSLQCKHC